MISVIVPTFNRESSISRALKSIISQEQSALEIIVADDGSTDGTEALIKRDFPLVKYYYQAHAGVSAARNLGMRMASGEWFSFLDSDDVWLPNKLARQYKEINDYPKIRILHSNEIWIRNGWRVNPMKKHDKFGGHIFKKCLPRCVISPSAAVVHRNLIDELGNFDENLPACEDYDLWLRLCAKYPVHYIAQPLIYKYGGHEDQLSQKYWGMDRFRIRSLCKLLDSDLLNQDQRQAASKTLNNKARIYIQGAKKRYKWQEVEFYERLVQDKIYDSFITDDYGLTRI